MENGTAENKGNGEFSGVMYRGMDTHKGEIVNAAQGAGMTATFIKYS